VTWKVLEPYLGFRVRSSIHEGNSTVFLVWVDVKRINILFWLSRCIIIAIIVVCLSYSWEWELFSFNFFNVSQLVEVHASERNTWITLFYFPCEAQSIWNLKESLIVFRKRKWSIFFLPFCNGNISNSTSLYEVNICNSNMILKEINYIEGDDVKNISDRLLVHWIFQRQSTIIYRLSIYYNNHFHIKHNL